MHPGTLPVLEDEADQACADRAERHVSNAGTGRAPRVSLVDVRALDDGDCGLDRRKYRRSALVESCDRDFKRRKHAVRSPYQHEGTAAFPSVASACC